MWTVVVPLALAACIYVVASIIGSARWSIGLPASGGPAAPTAPRAGLERAYTTRAGDTWQTVARRAHISPSRLHSLNPHDTARGRIVAGEHLLLRP